MATSVEELVNQAQGYDYIRCTLTDMNGVSRGRVIHRDSAAEFLTNGFGIYSGVTFFAPDGGIPMKTMSSIVAKGNPNATWLPYPGTLRSLPWAGGEHHRVAEVLGVTYMQVDGVLQSVPTAPREIAMAQLRRLERRGWICKSGSEMEFRILGLDDTPQVSALDYAGQLKFAGLEDFLFYMHKNLLEAEVPVETMHSEYSLGQFEFTLRAEQGIKAADDIIVFKHSVKEMAHRKDLKASFFGKSSSDEAGSGAHFNLSILKKENQKNVFYDESQPDNLSKIARHWIAGLVHHVDALTALCQLTVNCYRRLHQPWAPDMGTWGFDDRTVTFRVKNSGENGTFVENRLPSSMANPYLVMAGTLAAGLDGVEKELECPAALSADARPLPLTLEESLEALEADEAMKAALGAEFIAGFVGMKREVELPKFKDHDMKVPDEAHLLAEKLMYERLL